MKERVRLASVFAPFIVLEAWTRTSNTGREHLNFVAESRIPAGPL